MGSKTGSFRASSEANAMHNGKADKTRQALACNATKIVGFTRPTYDVIT
jgi:hypothetical protein